MNEQPSAGDTVRLTHLYASLPAGMTGTVMRIWQPPERCVWARVSFGHNLTGQPLRVRSE